MGLMENWLLDLWHDPTIRAGIVTAVLTVILDVGRRLAIPKGRVAWGVSNSEIFLIYPDSLGRRKALAKRVELDSFEGMIRPGFLLGDECSALIALARDGSVTHRLARRANALVLLDDGLSCEQVARVLLLDDDTIRRWHGAFAEGGRKALMRIEAGGRACVLSEAQRGKLVGWVRAASPRSTGQIGAWIASEFGVEYESRSGLVALLHRLGLEYRKPEVIPRHLDETKQRAFIKLYEKLMNALGADEAVLFVDAVHPTHGARAAGCWAAKDISNNNGYDSASWRGLI